MGLSTFRHALMLKDKFLRALAIWLDLVGTIPTTWQYLIFIFVWRKEIDSIDGVSHSALYAIS
jgi:hypothetical protein